MLDRNAWNHLNVRNKKKKKKKKQAHLQNVFTNHIFNIYKDLALNDLQWLICHKI